MGGEAPGGAGHAVLLLHKLLSTVHHIVVCRSPTVTCLSHRSVKGKRKEREIKIGCPPVSFLQGRAAWTAVFLLTLLVLEGFVLWV